MRLIDKITGIKPKRTTGIKYKQGLNWGGENDE
jgi:hypothetical protein